MEICINVIDIMGPISSIHTGKEIWKYTSGLTMEIIKSVVTLSYYDPISDQTNLSLLNIYKDKLFIVTKVTWIYDMLLMFGEIRINK